MCDRIIFLNDLTIEEFQDKFDKRPDNKWHDEISSADSYIFESILYILGEWDPEYLIRDDRDPYHFDDYDFGASVIFQIIKSGGSEKHILEYLEYYIKGMGGPGYPEAPRGWLTKERFKVRISECKSIADKLSKLPDIPDIFKRLDDIHIIPETERAIRRSIKWDIPDIVDWCKKKISDPKAEITSYGYGQHIHWDISIDGWVIEIWDEMHQIFRVRRISDSSRQ
jgi:hypothetical protein